MTSPHLLLEQRIRRLEDIEDIRRLRMQYHEFINQGRFEQVVTLFTPDAVVDFGHIGGATGTAAINALFLAIPRSLRNVTQFIHNHLVDVAGDVATGISYFDARYAQEQDSVMVASRFEEDYLRTEAGWRISRLRVDVRFATPITVGWAGEHLNHVKPFT